MAVSMVGGFACKSCADIALAKKGIDPARPQEAVFGNEVFVSPEQAARNRFEPPKERYGIELPPLDGAAGSQLNWKA